MKRRASLIIVLLLLCAGTFPMPARAAEVEVSGWIPYWAVSGGVKDAARHLDVLTAFHPFGFSVMKDGTLKDLAGMSKSVWTRLVRNAQSDDVLVIPTVMWSDTANIQTILSDKKLRAAHIQAIVDMRSKGKYDGVDIDYEGKLAKTAPYYSAFLKELKAALGSNVLLSCTIEARTPPDSLYVTVPKTLEYANDYKVINTYCDRVNIMTYDQQRADLKLNSARAGAPYYPIADTEWVRKVITLASKSIDKKKLHLGVATYGREVEVTVSPNWFQAYKQISSVSDDYARDTADKYDVEPVRNAAGELSYSYVSSKSTKKLLASVSLSRKEAEGDEVAARALAYANKTGKTVIIRTVWWSDAEAIAKKVALAKELGVAGIAIFKIDGKEDSDMWDSF
jgi:spore germination protein YaaH